MGKYQDEQWVIYNEVLSDQYECNFSLLLNSAFLLYSMYDLYLPSLCGHAVYCKRVLV